MLTEAYTVNLFGIDSKYYTNEYMAYIWEESAKAEYYRSGVFITAAIAINRLVCGEDVRGCNLGETLHRIVTTRNPAEVADKDVYYKSFINVVNDVRTKLGNPDMTIAVEDVDFFYFTKPQ